MFIVVTKMFSVNVHYAINVIYASRKNFAVYNVNGIMDIHRKHLSYHNKRNRLPLIFGNVAFRFTTAHKRHGMLLYSQ